MPEEKIAARYRYWASPPEFLTLRVADIEALIPKENWKSGSQGERTFDLPTAEIFDRNVPRISLRQLAEILPAHVSPSDGVVKLPAARLAAAYHLVEHREELPPEPEIVPLPPTPEMEETSPGLAPPPGEFSDEPARIVESTVSAFFAPPLETPAPEAAPLPVSSGKLPARRSGLFTRLPLFRKNTVPPARGCPPLSVIPEPPAASVSHGSTLAGASSPATDIPQFPAGDVIPAPAEPVVENPVVEPPEPVVQEPDGIPSDPFPALSAEVPPLGKFTSEPGAMLSVKMLHTEAMPREARGNEIIEQEPLQALFLTDEIMSVDRVIELCGGLPGINSCVLAHGSVVVASHNVPEGVDLVSMSAHAADMLQAMRASSARMGVGTVPAVTLHTEKGVISFFHRDDLTMLVFHRDRGFIPGVREKMAAVLGELTKARLTLPVGEQAQEQSHR